METILIVEDSKDYGELLNCLLTQKGYNVVFAASGQEAVKMAISHKPDIILMDIMMPHQDGPETVLAIRSQPALSHVPIIFLTALTSQREAATKKLKVKGEYFQVISKMLDQEEIIQTIRRHIKKAGEPPPGIHK